MAEGLVLLDTRVIDKAIEMCQPLLAEYNAISEKYDTIESALLRNWKGKGADAFKKDSEVVRTNLVGLNDILKTMSDMLQDCRDIFSECDGALKEYNENPSAK